MKCSSIIIYCLLACLPNSLGWVKAITSDMLTRATNYMKSLFLKKTNKQTNQEKDKIYTKHLRTTAAVTAKNLIYVSARGTQEDKAVCC